MPQNATGSSFESIDDLGDNKQVNVIRHDLDGMKRHAVFGGDLGEQRLEPRINRMRQDRATVFRAPHECDASAKTPLRRSLRIDPPQQSIYVWRIFISIAGYRAGARSGFPLSPQGDSPQPENMMENEIGDQVIATWIARQRSRGVPLARTRKVQAERPNASPASA